METKKTTTKKVTAKKPTAKKTTKIDSTYAYISAEYFVAAELSRRGFKASVTLKNTPGIDVVAVSPTEKMYCIQVKEKQQLGQTKIWLLKEKDEQIKGKNFFYALVNLNMEEGKQPDIYIVPNATVAKRIKEFNKDALARGKKKGNMRTFILSKKEEEKYQKWDILK